MSGVEIKKRMFVLRGRKGSAYFRLAELHSTLKASCFIVHGCTDSVVADGTIVGLDRAVPTYDRLVPFRNWAVTCENVFRRELVVRISGRV